MSSNEYPISNYWKPEDAHENVWKLVTYGRFHTYWLYAVRSQRHGTVPWTHNHSCLRTLAHVSPDAVYGEPSMAAVLTTTSIWNDSVPRRGWCEMYTGHIGLILKYRRVVPPCELDCGILVSPLKMCFQVDKCYFRRV